MTRRTPFERDLNGAQKSERIRRVDRMHFNLCNLKRFSNGLYVFLRRHQKLNTFVND